LENFKLKDPFKRYQKEVSDEETLNFLQSDEFAEELDLE
jgi:hypothetical protein